MRMTPGELIEISIHAPREGCDPVAATTIDQRTEFQSTHPVRGATMSSAGRTIFC